MSTTYDLPMPGDKVDGLTVIASGWLDDISEPGSWLIIGLYPEPPYYAVREYEGADRLVWAMRVENIHEAADLYAENGQDQ